jgi:hypothetical protein
MLLVGEKLKGVDTAGAPKIGCFGGCVWWLSLCGEKEEKGTGEKAFSCAPVGFWGCPDPARVGDPIVHGGVAILEFRRPRGDGRVGV